MNIKEIKQEGQEFGTFLKTRSGKNVEALISSAYQAGKDEGVESMKNIVTRARGAIPIADNGISRFGRSVCDEILLEAARNAE